SARTVVTGPAVLPKGERTFDRYFNTGVFPLAAVGTLGNAAETVLRGPGGDKWDSSPAERFYHVRTVPTRARGEAYNAFNHTQFSGVNTTAQFNPATGAQTNAAFGQLTAARSPRTAQLAAKIWF